MELQKLGKDKRTFIEKLKVTWYFDTFWSKVFLILSQVALMYIVFRFIWNLVH